MLICFYLFQNFKLSKAASFFLSLGIGFNPSLLYYASYVLSDFLLGSLTTLLWVFTSYYFGKENKINKLYNIYAKTKFLGEKNIKHKNSCILRTNFFGKYIVKDR